MKNEMPNEIWVNVAEYFGEPERSAFLGKVKYIRADSQPADVAGALDALFHYHGYTSHHVGEDKQKEVWSALQTIRAALTEQQPVNGELLEALEDIVGNFNGGEHPKRGNMDGIEYNSPAAGMVRSEFIFTAIEAIARAKQKAEVSHE